MPTPFDTDETPANSARTLFGRTWSVAALCLAVKQALHARFNPVMVQGEISAFSRASSGHCYFNLRDESGSALLRCAMFRRAAQATGFTPRDGMRVQVQGQIGVYEARGDLQLVVDSMQLAGQGALLEQFMQLKAMLEAEGLFAPEKKRPLARAPQHIGIVSSMQAAALEDVLTTLKRRVPHIPVTIASARVQGAGAAAEMVQALTRLQSAPVDVILLVRGGGSLEDLWAFNEVELVRAVAACAVPIINGVGHETDFTLCDFAADMRAPTPTAAAELCATPLAESLQRLTQLKHQLHRALQGQLQSAAQQLDHMSLRLARPSHHVHNVRARLQQAQTALHSAVHRNMTQQQQQCERLQERLTLLSPQQVLARGYAFLQDAQQQIVSRAAQVQQGQSLTATLAQGQISMVVQAN